jgi:CubicO group peptidase (beta-lactamase class C family)
MPTLCFSVRAALWVLAAAPALALGQPRSRGAIVAAIDSLVTAKLAGGQVAGMSVAVVKGRDTLVLKGYGSADLELDVPTPSRAVYEIGSVTKQFTAAAILQLRDDGKLSLDDDITKYLPDYPTQGHRITVRRLLDHTSGIKGYTELPKFGAIMQRKLHRDSLVALFKDEPFDFAPGDALIYNNSAYFLAGLIIEKVSGASYADYVKRTFFDKVGMADSRYCSESEITKRKAHGYDFGPGGLRLKGHLDHTYPYSAGSLCSTAGDLVAWNRALHGGRVLSDASYRAMITPVKLNDGTVPRYALGLALHHSAGHRMIEHGGGINGYLSASRYFPDDDAIIVVLMNTAGPVSPDAIANDIAAVALGKLEMPSVAFSGNLADLAGTYAGTGRGRQTSMHIAVDGGRLTVATQGLDKPAPLRFVGDDTWSYNGTRLTFVRPQPNAAPTSLRVDMVYGLLYLRRQP